MKALRLKYRPLFQHFYNIFKTKKSTQLRSINARQYEMGMYDIKCFLRHFGLDSSIDMNTISKVVREIDSKLFNTEVTTFIDYNCFEMFVVNISTAVFGGTDIYCAFMKLIQAIRAHYAKDGPEKVFMVDEPLIYFNGGYSYEIQRLSYQYQRNPHMGVPKGYALKWQYEVKQIFSIPNVVAQPTRICIELLDDIISKCLQFHEIEGNFKIYKVPKFILDLSDRLNPSIPKNANIQRMLNHFTSAKRIGMYEVAGILDEIITTIEKQQIVKQTGENERHNKNSTMRYNELNDTLNKCQLRINVSE